MLKRLALILTLALLLATLSCSSSAPPAESLTLATTTSTRDSGLLDALLPVFRQQTGIEVKVLAVGSGQALELGRRGDADVLLTHDPNGEQEFMDAGFGSRLEPIMHNDFVLVGPPNDPTRVRGTSSITDAFSTLATRQAPFISRGDDSGTHRKEQAIWRQAKVAPDGDWYIKAGAGMAHVLRMATEKRAYTLSDRSTYLAQRDHLDLTILSEGDPLLVNPYRAIVVSSAKHPHIKAEAATRFVEFLIGPEGQRVITEFGTDRYGQPLFFGLKAAP